MKRTNTILWSVATVILAVAVTAGPAAATTGYDWLNKSSQPPAASQPSGHSSINAILGAQGTASVAGPTATPATGTALRSVNSIVGTDPIPVETVSVVQADSGFSWEDAFIGAGAAFVLILLSAMTAYEVRRHRRVTVPSRA